MINLYEVTETNKMIEEENLDVRTTGYQPVRLYRFRSGQIK